MEIAFVILAMVITCVLWKKKKIPGTVGIAVLLLSAAGIGICLQNGFSGTLVPVTVLQRPGEGEGSIREDLSVQVGDETPHDISMEVPEEQLEKEQAEEQLDAFCMELDEKILGQNLSLEHVCYNLNLQSSWDDTGIQTEWSTDQPDLLDWDGTLGTDIEEEGESVQLEAELSLQGYQQTYRRTVMVFPSKEKEDTVTRLQREADELNEGNTGSEYYLPDLLDDETVTWFQEGDRSGLILILLAVALPVFWLVIRRESSKEQKQKRAELLDREYPDLVSRMQMLLGAGLSMRKTFLRIGNEYKNSLEKKNRNQKRNFLISILGSSYQGQGYSPACEEILISCRELDNGVPEAEVYERFGNRCGTPLYRGLALLLGQNLTKGGQGLMALLEQEAAQAFETRQRMARQEGEKISVRLLIPMGMMLIIVLMLIMIPAFMSY